MKCPKSPFPPHLSPLPLHPLPLKEAYHRDTQLILGRYEHTGQAVLCQLSALEQQLMSSLKGLRAAAIKDEGCHVARLHQRCWLVLQLLHLMVLHLPQYQGH